MLAAFFIPCILPVAVVFRCWGWLLDNESGLPRTPIEAIWGEKVLTFRKLPLLMPAVVLITSWWLIGFNMPAFDPRGTSTSG